MNLTDGINKKGGYIMSKKYLLGINNDNEIVFAEFGITTRNGYNEFTACFDTVAPFEVEESDGIEYMEELLDSCYDDGGKYRLCVQYDCAPSELPQTMAEKMRVCKQTQMKKTVLYTIIEYMLTMWNMLLSL